MRAIWKYPLEVVEEQKIETPPVWKPIHVDYQYGGLRLWAEVEVGEVLGPEVIRTIFIVGTGHPFDSEGLTYIGSAIDPTDPLVWHVYEVPQ